MHKPLGHSSEVLFFDCICIALLGTNNHPHTTWRSYTSHHFWNVFPLGSVCILKRWQPLPNTSLIVGYLYTVTSHKYTITHTHTHRLASHSRLDYSTHLSRSHLSFGSRSLQSRQTALRGAEVSPVCLGVFLEPQHQKYSSAPATWQFECAHRLSENVYKFLEQFGKNDRTWPCSESE